MSVQSDIFTTLGNYANLSAFVAARIYPDVAPQDIGAAVARVVWQEISDVPQNGLSGHNSLDNYRIQVTSWANSGTLSRRVDEQVRAAMAAASAFSSLCVDNRSLGYEPDTKLHGIQSDFSIWWRTP